MTRIVSGFAGSLTLGVPGSGTRPTSDRVREAIFSSLDARDAIRGAHVLDLYAGSGALGLEAASRGAASVTLVESNRAAAAVCRKNVAAVLRAASSRPPSPARANDHASAPNLRVVPTTVSAFLQTATDAWDLVFLDPPYVLSDEELVAALGAIVPRLNPGARVVVERSVRSSAPDWPEGLTPLRRTVYGDTAIFWLGI